MVKAILNLCRWKNLLIAGGSVFLMKYAVFQTAIDQMFPLSNSSLNIWKTALLAISVMLIAAAGYIINDIYDVKADNINKPSKVIIGNGISEKLANTLYIVFNILGIVIAAYIGKEVGNYQLALLHIIIAAILWIYSSYLKNSFLIGNILVAISSAMVPFAYFLFEGHGYTQWYGDVIVEVYKSLLGGPVGVLFNFTVVLGVFGFGISLIREIIKDLQDYQGDFAIGAKTLPITLGEKTTKYVVVALVVAFALLAMNTLHSTLSFAPFNELTFIVYTWLLIIIPLGDIIFGVLKAKESSDYQRPSNTCKFIMLTGTLTTIIYALNV